MEVRGLDWRGHGARVDAAAFGISVFYRVEGEPGNWILISPGAQNYIRTPGYETQAAAKAAAQVDFERRIKLELLNIDQNSQTTEAP